MEVTKIALSLTLLGPQSRFGDKLLMFRVNCPQIWECGSKRVKGKIEGNDHVQVGD